jgi:hypothetical protein
VARRPGLTGPLLCLDEDEAPGDFTARVDLAAAILDQLRLDTYVDKAVRVTTKTGARTLVQVIREEAGSQKVA